MTPTPATPNTTAAALALAKSILARTKRIQERLIQVHQRHGFTFLVGQRLHDLIGGSLPSLPEDQPTEQPNSDEEALSELVNTLQHIQQEVSQTGALVFGASADVFSGAPYAPEVAALEQDFQLLLADLHGLTRSPIVTEAYRLHADILHPSLWSDETLDRMATAMAGMLAAYDADPRSLLPGGGRPRTTPRATPANEPVAASELPWPTTDEAIRAELTYSPERDGSREAYLRILAARLRTPAQINDFMRVMFRYSEDFNRDGNQRLLNQQRIERNQLWHQPAQFLTTYNTDGRIVGDCKSIALAMTAVLRLQGREAFAIESSAAQAPGETGAIRVEGHMAAIWVERSGDQVTVHRLDTTETDTSDASVISLQANPGESDADLIVRAFGHGADHTKLFPDRLGLCSLKVNGEAFNLPANLALARRAVALEQALHTERYDDALGIVREEIARDPQNLNLRFSEIQLLLLKHAPKPELETVIAAIETLTRETPTSRVNPQNFYALRTTVNVLKKEDHEDLAARLQTAAQ